MSLDITILDNDENPVESIGINVDDHYRLMLKVDSEKLLLIKRMKDYYADAEFKTDELDILAQEVKELIFKFDSDKNLSGFLQNFSNLIEKAQKMKMPIQALAD